jgi:GAF domain-containing protein
MRTRLHRFNVLSWPIWVKLVVGFGTALLLVALPAALLLGEGISEVALQSGRTFVTESGVQQSNAIARALDVANGSLNAFVNDQANQRMLVGQLIGEVQSGVQLSYPDVQRDEVEAVFARTLLNPATSTFENVRLLDRNGRVLAWASVATLTALDALEDESASPAYRAGVAAQMEAQDRVFSVSMVDDTAQIEYVQALHWRDGSVLGYIIAKVNSIRAVAFNLSFTDQAYPGESFLSDSHGAVVGAAPKNAASRPPDRALLERALLGQTGVDVYTRENGEQMIAYYTLLRGVPLALITQVPLDAAFSQAFSTLTTRIFVVTMSVLTLLAIVVLLFNHMIAPPLVRLRQATQQFSEGNFAVTIADTTRRDEIGDLANAFAVMREAVRDLIQDLEARIAARSRDISATQEISRFAATQRDLQVLMDRVVGLIVERFGSIYHAQIFLIDSDREYAIVRASTGEVGKQLIMRGHRLGIGSVSVIGQVTEQGRYILARDTAASQVHRRNEFLPDTRAELAIPLRVGDNIIGALDVQSKQPDAFTEDLINVLQTMADQIAIAIQNARLYEESIRRVAEVEASNRQSTLLVWQEYMRDQRLTLLSVNAGVSTGTDYSELRGAALAQGKLVVGTLTDRQTIPVAVPVTLRGQTLGAVEWELPAQGFGDDKLELAQELANRLALSLDNARLFQESRRATERERLVNTIAAKLTVQTNIDSILQTAVREVGQALRAPQVSIRLHTQTESTANGSGSDRTHYHESNEG